MKFDIKKTIKYWTEGADYDIGVADAMFQTGKYPYVLFMGHLALEKLLKGIVVKNTRMHAPITHSLPYLAKKSQIHIPEEILMKLGEFMEFHFEARYPVQQKDFYTKCTMAFTEEKLKKIKEVFKWLKNQL